MTWLALIALLVAPILPAPTPTCSAAWDSSWRQLEYHAAVNMSYRSITATYLFTGMPMCAPVTDHEGTSAVLVNLSRYDRRMAAGGDLLQLGIWSESKGEPRFIYTADNEGGRVRWMPASGPVQGHRYTFSIAWSNGAWLLTIYDQTAGRMVHEVREAAHWSDAHSAWLMLETNDARQPFAPMTFGGSPIKACSERTVRAGGDGLYSVTETPCR